MGVSKETEEKIQKLQLLEQRLQNFLSQKQSFQVQLNEVESALSELKGKKSAYKIIGNIMVDTGASELMKDLNQKKEMIEIRIKNLEKQENKTKEEAKKLQSEVLQVMQNKRE
ncbi:MAG: prefoldin subunit [archaeon]